MADKKKLIGSIVSVSMVFTGGLLIGHALGSNSKDYFRGFSDGKKIGVAEGKICGALDITLAMMKNKAEEAEEADSE